MRRTIIRGVIEYDGVSYRIWGESIQPKSYLNAVVKGRYQGNAEALLQQLLTIETSQGRVRSIPNAARTLDLDLLVFGDLKCQTETLTLPHPLMLQRAFVLIPASEVDGKWVKYTRDLPVADIRATRYAGPW